MPCSDGGWAGEEDRLSNYKCIDDLKERNDELAQLLCSACRHIEEFCESMPEEVAVWWVHHKQFDKEEGR